MLTPLKACLVKLPGRISRYFKGPEECWSLGNKARGVLAHDAK